MPSGVRLQRIADRVRQEISEMLIHEINDPRLKQIFITDVKIDKELAFANIYVSAIEGSERSAEILEGLESASGFLRRTLSSRVEVRAFPKLKFHWDPTPENADHI
jgi:ribosome-binding factor A